MAQEDLDTLLSRMDAIAKAVNAFSSEVVQQEALSALMAAFQGRQSSSKEKEIADAKVVPPKPAAPLEETPEPAVNNGGKQRKTAKNKPSTWSFIRELDLHPRGKQSFKDFIDEKKPASNEDKFAAVVYYFSEVVELETVTVSHVGSTFRLFKDWREPGDLSASIRITSSRKGTLDTSNLESIKLTPTGRNFVEHELPPQSKTKRK